MQSNSSKRVIDLSQEPNDDGDTKRSRNDDYNTSFSNDEDYAMAVQAAFDQEREHEGNEYENENDMVIEKISRDRSYSDSESELDIKRAGTGIEELKWQPMYLLRSQYVTSDIHNNKCLSLNDLFTHTSPISSYTGSCGSIEEVVASTYLFKLEELYQNVLYQNVFNTETIQQMPTKIIQMRNDLYRRIKERYGNIAEHLFKKHFINRKTYIKEEQLLHILTPIIKEKNNLHKST